VIQIKKATIFKQFNLLEHGCEIYEHDHIFHSMPVAATCIHAAGARIGHLLTAKMMFMSKNMNSSLVRNLV
jgi:hypothetical protein